MSIVMAKDETPAHKHQNFGSVSLRLDPRWSRDSYRNSEEVDAYVGHENGIADIHLKNDPDKEHDFGWSNKKTERHDQLMRKRGFRPLLVSDGWKIRDGLAEMDIWRIENDLIMRGGDHLMVRDKEKWLREEEEKQTRSGRDLNAEADLALAGSAATLNVARPATRVRA